MDLDQILPQLLAGECPKTTEDLDALRLEYGVTAVLCLQTEDELAYGKIDWGRLESHYRQLGIEVQRVPVRDGDPDCLRRSLPECVLALDRLLRSGHKVFIHCSLGRSRAPTVIVAYLQCVQDWDFVEALDYVTACRPCDPHVEVLKLAAEDRRREPSANALSVTLG
jgi:atypical dual specificity phosphatase